MAGGQQITSGQGTVTAESGGLALAGSESTSTAGTAAPARLLPLRSRKVGGGSATRALTGQATSSSAGSFVAVPSAAVSGQIITGSLGAFGKTRSRAMVGASVSGLTGSPSISQPPSQPSTASDLPVFTLVRATGGTSIPFAIGQVFQKGAAPSGNTLTHSGDTQQVTVISTWDDGSAKHALVAGKVTLTASVASQITINFGTGTSGANLTESSLTAASPTASVSYGTYGTVSLTSLLGTSALVLTEHAGPQYAAFQYIAGFPNDSSVRAVFYVQLWQGGSYRVRVAVEFGQATNGYPTQSSRSGTATVTIAGVQVLNQSVTMLTGQRWDAVGGSFTQPSVTHDVAYLRRSKLVPNFGYTGATTTAINLLPINYTPIALMNYEHDSGAAGYAQPIGLLPHWDAMYCTTAADRARDSVIAHGRAFGTYGIFLRDTATRRMPKFSDWPTAYSENEDYNQMGAGGHRWEVAHHPNACHLAWLLTGERYFLEGMQANAWACYHTNSGSTANRLYVSQTRGRAWRIRTIGAVAALSPTGDLFAADCRANVAANLQNWKTNNVDTNTPATGLIGIYDDKEADAGFQHSIFESLFLTSSIGWLWDLEPGLNTAQKAVHSAVRDFAYRVPVGLTGRGQPTFAEFSWRRAPGPYRMVIGSTSALSSLYSTWDAVYDATYGDQLTSTAGLTILEAYADDPSAEAFPQSNWGHVLTALAYACDHGATNAQAGMDRITGASNWAANAIKWNDWPAYGVIPRAPSWFAAQSSGTWKNLGVSFMDGPGPMTTLGGDADSCSEITSTALFSYSGGFLNNASFYDRNGVRRVGAAMGCWGGGHNAYGGNEVVMFRLQDLTWYRIRDAYQTPTYSTSFNPDGTPNSRHTYQSIVWVPRTNELFSAITGARLSLDGSSADYSHSFSFKYTTPNGAAPGPWSTNTDFPDANAIFSQERTGLAACYDSDNRRVITVTPGRYRLTFFNVDTRVWTFNSEAAGSPISYSDQLVSVHIPGKNWLVCHTIPAGGAEGGLLVADMSAGAPNLANVNTAGSPPSSSLMLGITWDSANGRIVLCSLNGTLYYCTPPTQISGTWTFTSVAPTGDTLDSQAYPGGQGEGIWGRFGYVNDGILHGYMLIGGPDRRPAFYKL